MARDPVTDIIVRPDYRVSYEQHDGITFVHVQVRKWTSAIARQFRWDIDTAQRLLGAPVYVIDNPMAPNLTKFLSRHEFHPCGTVIDDTGREAAIFERSLDGRRIRRWHPDRHNQQRN